MVSQLIMLLQEIGLDVNVFRKKVKNVSDLSKVIENTFQSMFQKSHILETEIHTTWSDETL